MFNSLRCASDVMLEILLSQDPHIRCAVIFGRGRFNAGVLVDPIAAEQFDPANEERLVAFRAKIWYVLVGSSTAASS